jgi:hypothetical protein
MIYKSNDSSPTNGRADLVVLQPGTSNLIKTELKYAYRLSQKYPYGVQENMVVLLDKQRYKFNNGLWYRIGTHYTWTENETLLVPLPTQMLEVIRTKVSERLPELMELPLAFPSIALARQIAEMVLPPIILMELKSMLVAKSHYASILFDGLLDNWIGFDINNPTHEKIALGTKLVFLSFIGGDRTVFESRELVKTELGYGVTDSSRGGNVFFHEHIGGVYFMAKTSLSYCVCWS